MGRPREHNESTRAALLEAAERLVAERGASALSVRAVADAAGTTTRAVYSLFGSKDGLLVEALARDAFEFLYSEIGKLDETDDPASDLLDVGLVVFRRLVHEHPALYRIAFQRIVPGLEAGPELSATRQKSWEQLVAKVEPLYRQALATPAKAPSFLGQEYAEKGVAQVSRAEYAQKVAAEAQAMTFVSATFERFTKGELQLECRAGCAFAYQANRGSWRPG